MPDPFPADELALLAAAHADPKNDLRRLVYADWLDDHGSADHAEFIRLQCHQPHVMLANRDPRRPDMSHSHDFPHDDPTARERLDRLCTLLPVIYGTPRYARQAELSYREEHVRGLPLVQLILDGHADAGLDWVAHIGHLSRVRLALTTDDLAGWLANPLMGRVDELRLVPPSPADDSLDPDGTTNSHHDEFWATHLPFLAASPLLDRLTLLAPEGCRSCGDLTRMSAANMDYCRRHLTPRVAIDFTW